MAKSKRVKRQLPGPTSDTSFDVASFFAVVDSPPQLNDPWDMLEVAVEGLYDKSGCVRTSYQQLCAFVLVVALPSSSLSLSLGRSPFRLHAACPQAVANRRLVSTRLVAATVLPMHLHSCQFQLMELSLPKRVSGPDTSLTNASVTSLKPLHQWIVKCISVS